MTTAAPVYRRVLRRETHRPRTAPAVVVAVLLALLLLAALAAGVWAIADPTVRDAEAERAAGLDAATVATAAGVVLVVLAVPLLAAALLPGRRARRGRASGRLAVLIDDGALADAVADHIARRSAIGRDQVAVVVARRTVIVRVTPTSGVDFDADEIREAASTALDELGFPAAVRVRATERGVVS